MREYAKRSLPIFVLGLIGLAISVETESIHRRLATDVSFTSFCNIGGAVNCDIVIGSRYAELAGVSVSLLGIGYYLVLLGTTFALVLSGSARARSRLGNLLLALVVCGLVFSLWMAMVAFGILHAVCVMCSGLYLVAVATFVAVWWLRQSVVVTSHRQAAAKAARERVVPIVAVATVALLGAFGVWEVAAVRARPTTAPEVKGQDPEFFNWYRSQPVAAVSADAGSSRGDGAVTIIEFSDFGCGHCNAFHQTLEDVLRREGQGLRVVFRHFPLDSSCNPAVSSRLHPDSCLAAVAAECAGEQGKFWEYHNILFDNQQELSREFLLSYAARVHLDSTRFVECLASPEARHRVERDAQAGAQLGINSTPTVFINGRTIKGALDEADLAKALVLARDELVSASKH